MPIWMNVVITIFTCIGICCVVGVLVAAVMVGAKSEDRMRDVMDEEESGQ